MKFHISNVHAPTTKYTVMNAIEYQVLPRCPDDHGNVTNDGAGASVLPTAIDGKPLEWYNQDDITNPVEEIPFVDPEIQKKINASLDGFVLRKFQIGTFYRPDNTGPWDRPPDFSIEWEMDVVQQSMPRIKFESYYKLMRIEIEDPLTRYSIVMKYHNIAEISMPCDTREPYICFHLLTPPVFQKEEMHLPQTGNYNKNYLRRVGELCASHGAIAPYAHHIRIVLPDDHCERDVLDRFYDSCVVAGIDPLIRRVSINARNEEFFNGANLNCVDGWFEVFHDNWRVAFQIEALLRNGIAHTRDVLKLMPRIDWLVSHHESVAGELMRYFTEAAARRSAVQPLQKCFEAILQRQLRHRRLTAPVGRFFCHRVTFTPTRLLLEGPNVTQSNRVTREFKGYEDYFLRVSFRDEDRQQFKCARDANSENFVRERIGKLLKEGFELAGRHFKFLAYSSSALRTHAFWFMSRFWHPDKGWVTAERIRGGLGNFEAVIYSPSKYGARIGQAFTATDPSVELHKSQWSEMSDIQQNGIVFTDGIGTISQELAALIWQALCENYSDGGANAVQPTAYQIRFLGYKGMVVVDPFLEGIHMRLRKSMRKFDVQGKDYAEIEIASAFTEPKPVHLNRPLVMVLEDRGVPIQAFLELQEKVVSNTHGADGSMLMFTNLLKRYNLGEDFWVPDILRRLKTLGFELNPDHAQKQLDSPFLVRLRSAAINHVVRGIKYRARIPIPESYMLPGVADEGPAFVAVGYNNIYCLPEGKIFACIQNPGDKEPTWISGACLVYRSPVVHPGDVQRVEAIGKPPKNCLFAKLKNVVVFPAQGTRSLPNSLAGGDLDGDMYEVVQYEPFLDLKPHEPATYPPAKPRTLDRPSTVDDVCDFIVEYINSDAVGLVSDKHITIADESKDGTLDPTCLKLAELHSQAVDYAKNGRKVSVDDLPRTPYPLPDWHESEQPDQPKNLKASYYESSRALGYMYRNIKLEKLPDDRCRHMQSCWNDAISNVLQPLVQRKLSDYRASTDQSWVKIVDSVYAIYREELIYISTTHSLSKTALTEEELVLGTIMACSGSSEGYKKEPLRAMNESLSFLLRVTREGLVGELHKGPVEKLRGQLARAWESWNAWIYTPHFQRVSSESGSEQFGSHSFGLIVLGLVLDCLARMGGLPL
ncbi:RNA dependent RNA polymerase-domain-containing protein [Pisolithus orientalis]|uniref:RNA dependent RNA polymerase-domain-containing protein n=1 Tax=Pisolithus orientalis TaxID=936130 RepID=UPI002224F95D|nr:RNA dependent RNA polymerase-domain-containing protein [Pisolithus orientalis]KAI6002488.1 RNA dependent RNA polymerase-domain-containing protein [Pisolithus orientalis]